MWSISLLRGKALQKKDETDSGFAVYEFDDDEETINARYFYWSGDKYSRQDKAKSKFRKKGSNCIN